MCRTYLIKKISRKNQELKVYLLNNKKITSKQSFSNLTKIVILKGFFMAIQKLESTCIAQTVFYSGKFSYQKAFLHKYKGKERLYPN
jgi:hypothetical protein